MEKDKEEGEEDNEEGEEQGEVDINIIIEWMLDDQPVGNLNYENGAWRQYVGKTKRRDQFLQQNKLVREAYEKKGYGKLLHQLLPNQDDEEEEG